MFAVLVGLLLPGPLVALPEKWVRQEDLCIHSECGSYSDSQTGTVIDFGISDESLPWDDPCRVPTSGVAFRGSVGRYEYCGFEAPDSWDVALEELARVAPDVLCYVGDSSRVIMPKPETALIHVTFIKGNTTYTFTSDTCDEGQRAEFRRVVLTGDHLPRDGRKP